MALTRKMLKAMGIEDEKIDQIIEAHTETVDGLKAEAERHKADAKSVPGLQKQLKDIQDELDAAKKDGWKDKHDQVKKDFDDYKAEQAKKETHTAKVSAYRAILKEAGIADKYLDKVLKVCDVDSAELEDGKIKDAAALTESIKKEFDAFIVTKQTKGAKTSNPAGGGGGGSMTKDEIMAITDRTERRKAIAENMHLFTNEPEGE